MQNALLKHRHHFVRSKMTNVHTTLPLVFTEEKITEEAFAILDEPQFISKLLPSLGEQLKFIAHVRELKEKTKSQQKLIEEQVSLQLQIFLLLVFIPINRAQKEYPLIL
ncbi:hypothetical protein M8J77_024422 [Diaphorina citri]|nr:hypothetical protein M8J77_024422 [Diaphorina citri]